MTKAAPGDWPDTTPVSLQIRDPDYYPDDNMVKFHPTRNVVAIDPNRNKVTFEGGLTIDKVKIDPAGNTIKIDPANNAVVFGAGAEVKIATSGNTVKFEAGATVALATGTTVALAAGAVVGLATTANTVKLDGTANGVKLLDAVKIDPAQNTVKLDGAATLGTVKIDTTGNTIKLDTANNWVRIDPAASTVKFATSWIYTIPYYTEDSRVGSGAHAALGPGATVAETTITKGYWKIDVTASVHGVFINDLDPLNMKLMIDTTDMGSILVPAPVSTHIEAQTLKTQVSGVAGHHRVYFKSSVASRSVKVIAVKQAGSITTYVASIVCTRIGD